jgi:hypothetical protein
MSVAISNGIAWSKRDSAKITTTDKNVYIMTILISGLVSGMSAIILYGKFKFNSGFGGDYGGDGLAEGVIQQFGFG